MPPGRRVLCGASELRGSGTWRVRCKALRLLGWPVGLPLKPSEHSLPPRSHFEPSSTCRASQATRAAQKPLRLLDPTNPLLLVQLVKQLKKLKPSRLGIQGPGLGLRASELGIVISYTLASSFSNFSSVSSFSSFSSLSALFYLLNLSSSSGLSSLSFLSTRFYSSSSNLSKP